MKIVLFLFFLLVVFSSPAFAQEAQSNIERIKFGNPAGGFGTGGTSNIPKATGDIRQGLIDSFGITLNGFDNEHLQWFWNLFWSTSNTNFPKLTSGITIQANGYSGISEMIGCSPGFVNVNLGQYSPEAFFKFIATHEIGHYIQACKPANETKIVEQRNAHDSEGALSEYASNTARCFPGWNNNYNEDYADMIAYYLHPSAGLSSGPSSCGLTNNPQNPFSTGKFPLHLSIAEEIL